MNIFCHIISEESRFWSFIKDKTDDLDRVAKEKLIICFCTATIDRSNYKPNWINQFFCIKIKVSLDHLYTNSNTIFNKDRDIRLFLSCVTFGPLCIFILWENISKDISHFSFRIDTFIYTRQHIERKKKENASKYTRTR